MPKLILFILVISYLGCTPKPIQENFPPACTCDLLKDPQLLPGIEYESIESNRNRAVLESPQHILVDAGLELDENRKIDGNLKLMFPIGRKDKGYYVKYNIIPDKVNIDQQRYFIAYCSKFYSYVDQETCQIRSEDQANFNEEKDNLRMQYLRPEHSLPDPVTVKRYVKLKPLIKGQSVDYDDFHQQLKQKKSAMHYADMCVELFQFFTPSTTTRLGLKKEITKARNLYHQNNFASSADILLSVFETHFIN